MASQFRVILANMNTQFTGIFGHIVSGIEALDKVADIGGEGGRPEKIGMSNFYLSLQLIPYSQDILKFLHCPSSLDYRATSRLPVTLSMSL